MRKLKHYIYCLLFFSPFLYGMEKLEGQQPVLTEEQLKEIVELEIGSVCIVCDGFCDDFWQKYNRQLEQQKRKNEQQ